MLKSTDHDPWVNVDLPCELHDRPLGIESGQLFIAVPWYQHLGCESVRILFLLTRVAVTPVVQKHELVAVPKEMTSLMEERKPEAVILLAEERQLDQRAVVDPASGAADSERVEWLEPARESHPTRHRDASVRAQTLPESEL